MLQDLPLADAFDTEIMPRLNRKDQRIDLSRCR
jgi:hypothetical protein